MNMFTLKPSASQHSEQKSKQSLKKFAYRIVFVSAMILSLLKVQSQTTTYETIPAGSLYINMGKSPQTVANALKPYGLVYALLKKSIPVKWAFDPNKISETDTDVSILTPSGTVNLRTGTFIIEGKYVAAAKDSVTKYRGLGVVVDSSITENTNVPVFATFKYAPNWVLDLDNGDLVTDFFKNASIPSAAYGGAKANWKLPSELEACDDLFVMPHADPEWATHSNLFYWNKNFKGNIWAGCHAVSALENMVDPASKADSQTNFLTVKDPLVSLSSLTSGAYAPSNSLTLWTAHNDGVPPYTRRLYGDPVAQYLDPSDDAHQNGSEQIYLPRQNAGTTARWNAGTKILTYDPDQEDVTSLNPDLRNAAASNIYGRGFDDASRGLVFYQGGHDLAKGTGTEYIAAQRMFFNFSLLALQDKLTASYNIVINGVPATMVSGQTYQLEAVATGFQSGLTFSWTSDIPGIFFDQVGNKIKFKPTATDPVGVISCSVEDNKCNRRSIFDIVTSSTVPDPVINAQILTSPAPSDAVCQLTPAPQGSFKVTGNNLQGNIVIKPSAGYLVSLTTNPSTFTNTLTLAYDNTSGVLTETTVYAQLASTATAGVISGTISVTYFDVTFGAITINTTVLENPTASFNVTNVLCNGASNGAIDLTPTSGTAPYSYSWTGPDSYTNNVQDITSIKSGLYTVTIIDDNGCSSISSTSITQPDPVIAPSIGTITQPTCAVATGSVQLTGLPASGTWTVGVSNGDTKTGTGTSTIIADLAAGASYTFTVTNADGCTSVASGSATLNAQPVTPSAPTIGTITQPTCAVATGSVQLTGLPASGTWTVGVSNGDTKTGTGTSTIIADLAAGASYTFTVTNADGCTSVASSSATLNAQPVTPSAPTIGTITQPTCAVATGSVQLTGLPASGTWTVGVSNGDTKTGTGTSTIIADLAAGASYTFTVTNEDGCTSVASSSATLNAQPVTPSAPTIGTITQPTCAVATGSVQLTGLPASGTWTVGVSNGDTKTGTGTSTIIADLAAGASYTFTVTNADGCTSVASSSATLNAQPVTPTAPTLGTITQATCAVATGSVQLTGLPASGTWTVGVSNGTTQSGTGTTAIVAGLSAGASYTFTVTNADGCTSVASGSVTLNVQPLSPSAPIIGTITQATCDNGAGSVALSGLPLVGSWTVTASNSSSITGTGPTAVFSGLSAGNTYTFKVTNELSCVSANSLPATLLPVPENPTPIINIKRDTVFCIGDSAILSTGAATSYQWYRNGRLISGATGSKYSAKTSGTYTVMVVNLSGCNSAPSNPVVIVANALPAKPAIDAEGPTTFCSGGSVKLTAPESSAYIWYKNGVKLNDATQRTYTANTSGRYTVAVKNSNGCTSDTSTGIVVVVNPIPDAPLSIQGATDVIIISNETYTATAVSGATKYNWTIPSGWSGSSDTNIIVLSVRGNPGTDTIFVTATANGCTGPAAKLAVKSKLAADHDKDGYPDEEDLDDDNDGILDVIEYSACGNNSQVCDTDNDGIRNSFDLDSDGDGISDVLESDGKDTNSDGIADGAVDSNGVPTSAKGGNTPPDTDKDGKMDPYDLDTDGDGIPDRIEGQGPTQGGQPLAINPSGKDTDADGLDDAFDNDNGGKYIIPVDTDKDGKPDWRDLDTDNDGIPDEDEAGSDPTKPLDTDKDTIYDFREVDSDGDGIPDGETLLIYKSSRMQTTASIDGTIEMKYTIILKNNRSVALNNVTVSDDLTKTFPTPIQFTVVDYKTSGKLIKASGFNGSSSTELLASGSSVAGFGVDSINITLSLKMNGYEGVMNNLAVGKANTKWGPVTRESIDLTRSAGRAYGSPGVPTYDVAPKINLFIPDVITPNNDGVNDKWTILRPSNLNIGVTIFNRWGQIVYKSANYQNDWDGVGKQNFLGQNLPHGTYYYLVDITDKTNGSKQVKKGFITLKRDN